MALGDFSVGDSGSGVADLQRYLSAVGYDLVVDGIYGSDTFNAVRSFQAARGIRVDGIAGPETLIELSKAQGEGWTAPPMAASQPSVPGTLTTSGTGTMTTKTPTAANPYTGLLVLVGLAIGIWYLTSSKGSSGGGRRHAVSYAGDDDPDAEPGDGEEEEEEEGDE